MRFVPTIVRAAMALLLPIFVHGAQAQSANQGTAEVNGTKLYYEMAGKGHALVLIHGGAVDRRAWDDQFLEFSKHFKVIRYDLRGSGKSAQPDQAFSNTEDLYALLRFLKVDKAYLAGISRGGGVAFDFTLAHPDMVDRLILVSSNLGGVPQAYRDMFARATEAGKKQGANAGADVWWNDPYQGPSRENEAARTRVREVLRENIATFLHFAPGSVAVEQRTFSKDTVSRLVDIHIPTLIIAGEKDNVDARANYDRWAKGIPGAKKIVVQGAAHLVNIDRPKEFNRAVLDFLQ